jgi:hypothetical protein
MLIKEWHTQLQQELNKINSSLYDVLLTQEIDIAFNKSIEMFINQRYSAKSNRKQEGFEASQKRIDDLKSLVTVYKAPAILGSNFDNSFSYDQRSLFILPQDYRFKVATRINSAIKDCNLPFIPLPVAKEYHIFGMDLSAISNYSTFAIRLKTSTTVILPANGGLGGYSTDDFGVFKNIIVDGLLKYYPITKPIYFENFYTYTNKNYLFIVYPNTPSDAEKLQYYNGSAWVDFGLSSGTIANAIISDLKYPTSTTYNVSSDKQVSHDAVYALQADPFSFTNADFPLSFFENNYYYTLYDKLNFVVSEVEMTYICKPKTVSYIGNISCDLPDSTHQEIISMTAQYFLEEFEAGRVQTHKETVLTTE